ncbi:MAG: crotonase/enoyl-CoA hydratase family protein [Desulfobacterales bacterium]
MMYTTIRTELDKGVFSIILCRPEAYNTITPELANDLGTAIDEADADEKTRVILLRSEGPAFCAGYGLDWSTKAQAAESDQTRIWDSIADYQMMSGFVNVYQKLWYASKPSIAAVQGWCICGGTDLVLWSDIIIASETSVFGYPTSRLWGVPTTAMWVYRIGFEKAKRYLLTGDEIPGPKAAEIGLILETVPDDKLQDYAMAMARRMALLPLNQLQMIKLYCNQIAENMGIQSQKTLGILFDGVARHTQEGLDFVKKANEIGFRAVVRRRDEPFGDYGSGPRAKKKK